MDIRSHFPVVGKPWILQTGERESVERCKAYVLET
jgi:hypothetical protein